MITNSYILDSSLQTDGRRYIIEVHEDDVQGEIRAIYLAEPNDDIDQILADRALAINEQNNG